MQQCGDCLKIYDESEYAHCPYCDDVEEKNPFESLKGSCAECDGTGRVECYECEGEGGDSEEVCSVCNGQGDLVCGDCNGSGEATQRMEQQII